MKVYPSFEVKELAVLTPSTFVARVGADKKLSYGFAAVSGHARQTEKAEIFAYLVEPKDNAPAICRVVAAPNSHVLTFGDCLMDINLEGRVHAGVMSWNCEIDQMLLQKKDGTLYLQVQVVDAGISLLDLGTGVIRELNENDREQYSVFYQFRIGIAGLSEEIRWVFQSWPRTPA